MLTKALGVYSLIFVVIINAMVMRDGASNQSKITSTLLIIPIIIFILISLS